MKRTTLPPTVDGGSRNYYVYMYFLLDGSPCWVGKGSGYRFRSHLWSPEYTKTNKDLLKLLQGAKDLGTELPVVIIRDNLTEDESFEIERLLIEAIGCRRDATGPLVNYTKGTKHDAITREKMRQANLGKKRTPEARERMRQAKLGTHQSTETIEKRLKWAPGSRWINNGTRNERLPQDEELPEGWSFGRCGTSLKGMVWITDGVRNRRLPPDDPIPDGWRKGYVADFTARGAATAARRPSRE